MTPATLTIPYNYVPRFYQVPLYNAIVRDKVKRAVSIWHRRAGKDKSFINIMTTMAWADRVGSYFYFLPTLKQGRKILWDGMGKDGFKFLDHIPQAIRAATNSTEMKITLLNGSIIQIVGSDYIDAIVGTNPVGCVFSEYSLQNPSGWEFIRPILRENGGWAAFNYTPRGKNHGYTLKCMAEKNEDWFYELKTIRDTGVLSEEDVEAERQAGMSEDMIQQEFYCSFEASIAGAYYARQMDLALKQRRICAVPIESGVPVDTWWDLGIDDSTSIWFTQDVGREVHLVRYYENSGEGLRHYVNYIKDFRDDNQVTMGRTTLPHDGKKRELATGKSIQDFLYELGVSCDIAPRPQTKEDGIEAVRQFLGKCWFGEPHCDRGIEGLRQYRKEWDEVNGVYRARPVHDWTSHVNDAIQTLALSHRFTTGLSGFRPKRGGLVGWIKRRGR